jgi:hypothetical protein
MLAVVIDIFPIFFWRKLENCLSGIECILKTISFRLFIFSTGEKEMVILEREAYAFTSGIALGTVLFKVKKVLSYFCCSIVLI